MGFQVPSILFSFSICSFFLKQVRHIWGSNGSTPETLGCSWDVLSWRGLRLPSYIPFSALPENVMMAGVVCFRACEIYMLLFQRVPGTPK